MLNTIDTNEYFFVVDRQPEPIWKNVVSEAVLVGKALSKLRARTGTAVAINTRAALRLQLEAEAVRIWKLYEIDGGKVTNERTLFEGGKQGEEQYLVALSGYDQEKVDIYKADATRPDLLVLRSNDSMQLEESQEVENVSLKYRIEGNPLSFPKRGQAIVAKDSNLTFVMRSFLVQKPQSPTVV